MRSFRAVMAAAIITEYLGWAAGALAFLGAAAAGILVVGLDILKNEELGSAVFIYRALEDRVGSWRTE